MVCMFLRGIAIFFHFPFLYPHFFLYQFLFLSYPSSFSFVSLLFFLVLLLFFSPLFPLFSSFSFASSSYFFYIHPHSFRPLLKHVMLHRSTKENAFLHFRIPPETGMWGESCIIDILERIHIKLSYQGDREILNPFRKFCHVCFLCIHSSKSGLTGGIASHSLRREKRSIVNGTVM